MVAVSVLRFRPSTPTAGALWSPLEWLSRHHVWVAFAAEVLVLLLVVWIAQRLLLRYLSSWHRRSGRAADDEFVSSVRRDSVSLIRSAVKPLLLLGGLAVAVNSLPVVPAHILAMCNRLFALGMIVIALYVAYRAAMLVSYAWLRSSTARAELADPAAFFIRVLFAGLGIMLLLDNLGVSLTAVWTSLGIGSIAVALALQDTLSNFFAGVYLRLDRPVKMGDYVKIEGKEEGYVDHLGWRSTWIKTRDNTVVVVPNAKLSSSVLTNYSMPGPQLECTVRFSVGYDADLDHVEAIVVEEAKALAGIMPGLLADPAPYVELIPGFGAYALNLQLNFTVANYEGQFPAQHELRKRILARFRKEGIAVPYPQRDVHVYHGPNEKDLVSEFVGKRPIQKSA